ncbi:MAG: LysM domain-containing protein [Actinomycetota bacterium]|nr:LysM domain-containing protein [Actinomycetota bacterium]
MKRARLGFLAAAAIVAPLAAGGCGDDQSSGGTLPPIITTTTSTTVLSTTTTVPQFYVIASGDTLAKIAAKFGVTQSALIALNNITDPDHIEVGAELQIPQPGQVIPTTTVVTTTTIV